jgi:hypothetical protein
MPPSRSTSASLRRSTSPARRPREVQQDQGRPERRRPERRLRQGVTGVQKAAAFSRLKTCARKRPRTLGRKRGPGTAVRGCLRARKRHTCRMRSSHVCASCPTRPWPSYAVSNHVEADDGVVRGDVAFEKSVEGRAPALPSRSGSRQRLLSRKRCRPGARGEVNAGAGHRRRVVMTAPRLPRVTFLSAWRSTFASSILVSVETWPSTSPTA